MLTNLKRIKKSIFSKLLLVIILTGVLINLIVGFSFSHFFGSVMRDRVTKNIRLYANYIIKDLGEPPDYQKAKKLAQQYFLTIQFKGQQTSWSTTPQMIKLNDLENIKSQNYKDLYKRHRKHYFLVKKDYGVFLISVNLRDGIENLNLIIVYLLIILTVVLIIVYLIIKRVLRPIRWLTEAVRHIHAGDLKHQIRVLKDDELGILSDSFNKMVQRIEIMIRSKEQLLLDVSHELRSPVTRIKVALELLPHSPKRKAIQDDIIDMETMLNEILEEHRIDSIHGKIKPENINIVFLVKEIIERYNLSGNRIIFNSDKQDIILGLDSDRIKIVLKNLLDNAVRYSKSNLEPIEVSLNNPNDTIILTIRDQGPGIPSEDIPYIFEPYYRVDPSRSRNTGGYGLGMSLCRKIVEAHGGVISLTSELGKGCLVRVELPANK